MIPGRAAAGTVAAAAASLALAVSGCGQVSVGDQTPGTADPAVQAKVADAARRERQRQAEEGKL